MKYTFDKSRFVEQIKDIRKEHHLTQQAFADIIGCSKETIKDWESTKVEAFPKLEYLLTVCAEFNTDLISLLYGYEAFPPSAERISHELGLSLDNVNKIRKLNRTKNQYDHAEKLDIINMILSSDGIINQILFYKRYGSEIFKVSKGISVLLEGEEADQLRVNDYSSDTLLDGIKGLHLKELQKAIDKAIKENNPS